MFLVYLILNFIFMMLAFLCYIAFQKNLKDYSLITSFPVSIVFLYFFPLSLSMSIVFTGTLALNSMYRRKSIVGISLFSIAVLTELIMNFQRKFSDSPVPIHRLGVSISLLTSSYMKRQNQSNEIAKGHTGNTEVYRDILQIGTGIVIIYIMIFWSHLLVELILIAGMLVVVFILDLAALHHTAKISKLILKMERTGVGPGFGTLWFIAGLMLLISLTPKWKLVEIGVFAMAIGDSLATIGGMNFGIKKLFYNRKKSVGGFIFMLIPTALFTFFILGPSYLFIAVLATVIESVSGYPLDDNITIPSSVIIGNLIMSII
jgi:Dolichol kinase